MNVAILTLPMHNNYGGILQGYALQCALEELGHSVTILNYRKIERPPKVNPIKRLLCRLIYGKKISLMANTPLFPGRNEFVYQFINEYLHLSKVIYPNLKYEDVAEYNFDAFVVGSDQVWRKRYTPSISSYFFDFLADKDITKIAYAASFGINESEFDKSEIQCFAKLLKQFKGVSVREQDALGICKEHFDVNATYVLDPTLLLNKSHYCEIIDSYKCDVELNLPDFKNKCGVYILDNSKEVDVLLKKMKEDIKFDYLYFYNKKGFSFCLDNYVTPSMYKWLKMFRDSEFIVTDSFHGTVFSIIFQKPFVVISNKTRGESRLRSLLGSFNLMDRLLSLEDGDFDLNKLKPIDWDNKIKILEEKRLSSLDFIKKHLNNRS